MFSFYLQYYGLTEIEQSYESVEKTKVDKYSGYMWTIPAMYADDIPSVKGKGG
jgi:hypothetical protein